MTSTESELGKGFTTAASEESEETNLGKEKVFLEGSQGEKPKVLRS